MFWLEPQTEFKSGLRSIFLTKIRIKVLNVFGRNLTSNAKCSIKVRLLLIIVIKPVISLHMTCVLWL